MTRRSMGGRGDAKVAQNGLGPTDTKVSTTGAACRQKGLRGKL